MIEPFVPVSFLLMFALIFLQHWCIVHNESNESQQTDTLFTEFINFALGFSVCSILIPTTGKQVEQQPQDYYSKCLYTYKNESFCTMWEDSRIFIRQGVTHLMIIAPQKPKKGDPRQNAKCNKQVGQSKEG